MSDTTNETSDEMHRAALAEAEAVRAAAIRAAARRAPCDPSNRGCRCAACDDACDILETDPPIVFLTETAVPARGTMPRSPGHDQLGCVDRGAGERKLVTSGRRVFWQPEVVAPGPVLAHVRAYVVKLAARHGETVDGEALTSADLARWELVEMQERAAAAEQHRANLAEVVRVSNDAAEVEWNAFRADYPRAAAVERRKIAILAYEAVIPEQFAPVIPMEAGTTAEERAALWDELSKPNERGAVRIRFASDYKAAMDAAVAIANGQERTVLLGGDAGAGKTTLAALMLRRIALEWMRNPERGIVPSQAPPRPWARTSLPTDVRADLAACMNGSMAAPPHVDGDPAFRRLAPRLPRKHETPEAPLVVWTTADEIFRLQSAPQAFPKPGEEPADPLAAIRKARVLVIDEIGKEPDQKNVLGVGQIVYERHDAGDLVTIVTSGFTVNDVAPREDDRADVLRFLGPLVARYGTGFTRRIGDPGICTTLGIGFRREKGAPRGPKARTAAKVPDGGAPAAPARRSMLDVMGLTARPVTASAAAERMLRDLGTLSARPAELADIPPRMRH